MRLFFDTREQGWLSQNVLGIETDKGEVIISSASALLSDGNSSFEAALYQRSAQSWAVVLYQTQGDLREQHYFLSENQGQTWTNSPKAIPLPDTHCLMRISQD